MPLERMATRSQMELSMGDVPTWLIAARGDLGQAAIAGPASNPYVVGLYALAGHATVKTDDVPW